MDGTAQETARFARSILTTKMVAHSAAGETFESRGKRGLKIFAPPTHVDHRGDPLTKWQAEEAETDPKELAAQKARNAFKGHAGRRLRGVLKKLPKRQCEVVELLLDGKRPVKIASILGIAESTVRVHYHEAKSSLSDLVRDTLIESLTPAEIAERLKIPEPQVRQDVRKAKKNLRELKFDWWREVFPLSIFVHPTDSREVFIEHQQKDNRIGAEVLDELIDDRNEWYEKHEYSPSMRDSARFSANGQKRFAVPLKLDPKLQSNYVRDDGKPTDVKDNRPLTEEQHRAIDAALAEHLILGKYKIADVVAWLKPLPVQAHEDAITPQQAEAAVAEVLEKYPGEEADIRLSLQRANSLWEIIRKQFEAEKSERLQAMAKDRRVRRLGVPMSIDGGPLTAIGPAPRTEKDLRDQSREQFERLRVAHIHGRCEP